MLTRILIKLSSDTLTANAQDRMTLRWQNAWLEAVGVAIFMLYLSAVSVLLEYPGSWVHAALPWPMVRRAMMGIAAGLSLMGLGYSPWGQRTGAHINPAVTLAMRLIGRISSRTTALYIVAQLVGALAGMAAAEGLLGRYLAHPQVDHIITAPGDAGSPLAFVAEAAFSFVLMTLILAFSSRPRWAPYTGLCVGISVAVFIFAAAPLSGMSMNPARTLGAAWAGADWHSTWIYLVAPPFGMLAAAALFLRLRRLRRPRPLA